jgi:hypothetical protein
MTEDYRKINKGFPNTHEDTEQLTMVSRAWARLLKNERWFSEHTRKLPAFVILDNN